MYEEHKQLIFDKAYKNTVFFCYLLIGEVVLVSALIEIFRRISFSDNSILDALPKDTTLRSIVLGLMLLSFLFIHFLAYRLDRKRKNMSRYSLAIKSLFQSTLLKLLSFMPVLGLSIALTFIENNPIFNWIATAVSIIVLVLFFPRKKNWENALKNYEEL